MFSVNFLTIIIKYSSDVPMSNGDRIMQNRNIRRLQRIGKYGSIATTLAVIFCAFFTVACVIMLIVFTMRPDLLESGDMFFSLIEMQLAMAMGAIGIGLAGFIMFKADKLMKNLKTSHTPFTEDNSVLIRHMAYLIFVYSAILPLINYVLVEAYAPEVEEMIPFSIGFVLVALLFYGLALVFEYGTGLQKDSDETL